MYQNLLIIFLKLIKPCFQQLAKQTVIMILHNKASTLLKLIYQFELMHFKFRFLLQLASKLITGFKLSLVGAQPRHISSLLLLRPENSWINFFLGHDFAPPGAEKTLHCEENGMAGIPVQAEFARKWLGSKWQGKFPVPWEQKSENHL